jgi:dTDP-4-amino-4,6-dideoxygalactose transaminase
VFVIKFALLKADSQMPVTQNPQIKVSNFKLLLSEEDKKFILGKTGEVLSSHRWTVGPQGEAFEEAFKRFTGFSRAVAVANGGAALVAVLQALEIPEGRIVVCPTLTAPPTPHAILAAGMKVVFADSNPDDLGLDPEDLRKKLDQYQGRIGAVIAVHVGGWVSPNIQQIHELCRNQGIPLIEDGAHAHGSRFQGRHAGSWGRAATFSFFMTKPLTSGEGGIVTTEDKSLVEAIRLIRNYGKNEKGAHVTKGFNFKMSEFDAVVALWASLNASRLIEERRKIAAIYDRLLEGLGEIRVVKVPGCDASYYKYIVVLASPLNRDQVNKRLFKEHGIESSGGVYDTLCHQEPYFCSQENVLNGSSRFPQAEAFAKQQLCLPLYPGLTEEEQHLVVEGLRNSLK